MKRKVMICGATGFIGRNIAETLCQREDIEVFGAHFNRPPLDNERIHPVHADLTDPRQVDAVTRGMDVIIQAAATTSGSRDIFQAPYIHVTDNAVMNSLILRAAYEHEVSQLIFFSCTVMYQSGEHPLKESDFNPADEMHPRYFGVGWTKVYIEKMCEFYSRLGRTKHTVIRHSNIYGPHDKFDLEKSHVFGATMTKVMTTDTGSISVWGGGTEGRDLLYISDLVEFVELAMVRQHSPFELVNLGLGRVIKIKDLVEKIVKFSGRDIRIDFDLSQPSINTSLSLDTSIAKEAFGWQPKVSLEEGIKRTMLWYSENFEVSG